LLDAAGRTPSATASRPVRRMVVQSKPYTTPHTRQIW
jgi:hypothetical protein